MTAYGTNDTLAEMRQKGWFACFSPREGKITVDSVQIRTCPHWRRQWLALLAHELCHAFDWYITYRKNVESWNTDRGRQEKRADKIQDMVLIILGLGSIV